MKSAREQFEERWENQQATHQHPEAQKGYAWDVYICGWEDAVKHYLLDKTEQV